MGTLFIVLIVSLVVIVLGGIVALAIRSALSVQASPPAPPSTLQTEPLENVATEASQPKSPEPSRPPSEPSHTTPKATQAEEIPGGGPSRSFRDPSLLSEDRPSTDELAKGAVKDWAIGHIPFVGVPLVADRYLKKLGHTPFTGMDAGYARIPGAVKNKTDETEKLGVTVSASGTIRADDREVSMAELEEKLVDLASRGGQVVYYAEPAEQEPPQAAQVLDCIFRLGVSVTFRGNTDAAAGPSQNA